MSEGIQVYNYGNNTLEAAYWLSKGLEHGARCKITASQPANFITPIGAYKKRKEIEAKGLPGLKNSRFITLTLNRDQMGDAQTGYETGKRQLRQFMYELRKSLGVTEAECPHCWKLEFHQDGWAHWHILFLYRKSLPFALVDAAWRLGRTETQRVSKNDLDYLFKYVTKGGETLPLYITELKQVRFWQTSKHFHTLRTTAKPKASPRQSESIDSATTEKGKVRKESTLGERVSRWMRTISIRIGRRVAVVEIASFATLIQRAAYQASEDLTLGYEPILLTSISMEMPADRAIEFLEPEFRDELQTLVA